MNTHGGGPESMTPEPMTDGALRRWMSTWVVIGTAIVAVTAVFLVLISNSLVRINADLTKADSAVTDVSGNARTLPDQIRTVNASLAQIDEALHTLPRDTGAIATKLDGIVDGLKLVKADLAGADPSLVTTAGNLVTSAHFVPTISANIKDAAALLETALGLTGPIHTTLTTITGSGGRGLAGIHRNLEAIKDILAALEGDLGNILATNRGINNHLAHICRSPAISLLHGPQQC
jgi:hypothetical protein